jgi:hypothetical protein
VEHHMDMSCRKQKYGKRDCETDNEDTKHDNALSIWQIVSQHCSAGIETSPRTWLAISQGIKKTVGNWQTREKESNVRVSDSFGKRETDSGETSEEI